jgi:hypothetical protein
MPHPATGWRDPFDVQAWENGQNEILEKKQRRYAKRKVKRRLKGLPKIHPVEEDSSSGAEPLFVESAEGQRARAKTDVSTAEFVVSGHDSGESDQAATGSSRIRLVSSKARNDGKGRSRVLPPEAAPRVAPDPIESTSEQRQPPFPLGSVPRPAASRPSIATAAASSMTGISAVLLVATLALINIS